MYVNFEELKKLQVGDIRYECSQWGNLEFRVTETPVVSETTMPKTSDPADGVFITEQLRWKAVNTKSGREIDYLLTDKFTSYGPKIYTTPQYGRFKDGEIDFPLVD